MLLNKRGYYFALAIPLLAITGYFLFHDFSPSKNTNQTSENTNQTVEVTRPTGGYFLEVQLVGLVGHPEGIVLPIRVLQDDKLIQEKQTNADGYIKFGLPPGYYTVEAVGNVGWSPWGTQNVTLDADKLVQIRGETNVGQ